jgi:BirA family biotin operon repressor/biotin-[acetyl-CoA-carboxylase] ligase
MIVLTDKIDHSSKYFHNLSDDFNFVEIKKSEEFENSFFENKPIYYSTDKAFWNIAVINEYSEESQFDLLLKLSGKNKLIPDKTICIAGYGTKFHGFHGRKWESLLGNIHLSAYFRPMLDVSKTGFGFTMLAAVSVIDTLDSIPELKNKAQIKWVNDIVIGNSKICGVIAQNQIQGNKITDAVIGIGLNVEKTPDITPTSYIPEATCVNDLCLDKQNIGELTNILLDKVELNYKLLSQNGYSPILEKYRTRSMIIRKNVSVWSDNFNSVPQLIRSGKVISIGNYLELYLENQATPVTTGRIVFENC